LSARKEIIVDTLAGFLNTLIQLLVAGSTFVLALCTIIIMVCTVVITYFGRKSLIDFREDLEYRSRPHVDFVPDFSKTVYKLRYPAYADKTSWDFKFLLSNGSNVPVDDVSVILRGARIGQRELFMEQPLWKEDTIRGFVENANEADRVEARTFKGTTCFSPQSLPLPFVVNCFLEKNQLDQIEKASQLHDVSLYIYYIVLYRSVFRHKYRRSYFWEFKTVPKGTLAIQGNKTLHAPLPSASVPEVSRGEETETQYEWFMTLLWNFIEKINKGEK
jgi:hypothetical protein